MRTVQQHVFLILNSVPVTSVTDPELIRPSIPVMTHSLDQKVVARKAKAKKCAAEVAGNIQVSISLSVKNGYECTRMVTRGYEGLQGVTRMAYSPRLWLMAIGW